jgi:geranylgeranyl diphosphate synthase type II
MNESYLNKVSTETEAWVKAHFEADNAYAMKLYEAMRYSLMAGGKRLRPGLLLMAYSLFNDENITVKHPALPFAAAVEMIHTYSLIHDDLPGMDNDDLRRGKPTNHIVYGEAAAILAGDGLLTKSMEIFLDGSLSNIPLAQRAAAAAIVFKAAGPDGMVAGQYVDMLAQGASADTPEQAKLSSYVTDMSSEMLNYIHAKKTAALISASIQAGAVLAGADEVDRHRLEIYGDNIGVAFQIADDILDVTSTSEALGKPVGSDEKLDKLTYPKLYGLTASKKMLSQLIEGAIAQLERYGDRCTPLAELAKFVGTRTV